MRGEKRVDKRSSKKNTLRIENNQDITVRGGYQGERKRRRWWRGVAQIRNQEKSKNGKREEEGLDALGPWNSPRKEKAGSYRIGEKRM